MQIQNIMNMITKSHNSIIPSPCIAEKDDDLATPKKQHTNE